MVSEVNYSHSSPSLFPDINRFRSFPTLSLGNDNHLQSSIALFSEINRFRSSVAQRSLKSSLFALPLLCYPKANLTPFPYSVLQKRPFFRCPLPVLRNQFFSLSPCLGFSGINIFRGSLSLLRNQPFTLSPFSAFFESNQPISFFRLSRCLNAAGT